MTRKDAEIRFKREYIISAAERIFVRKGFDQTTMEEISSESEFSKPTLYAYFKSKHDIVYSSYIKAMNDNRYRYDAVFRKQLSFREKIKEYALTYLVCYQDNPVYLSFHLYWRLHNPSKDAISEQTFKDLASVYSIKYLEEILLQGIREGEIDATADLNNIYIHFMTSLHAFTERHIYRKKEDMKEFLDFVELTLRGYLK